ncbi:MAG: HAMP domain-containing protein [Rhodocyclaceae bacterium]|nr:HAMP domain-containing protein [Rhodocyclaceae bacterium]
MSRLAIKLFAGIWLAFLLLLAGLSFVVDRWDDTAEPQPLGSAQLRQWQQMQERTATVFQRRGLDGLAQFARDVRENRGMDLFLLGDDGQDLLDQPVAASVRDFFLAHRAQGPLMHMREQRMVLGPAAVASSAEKIPGQLLLWLPITDVALAPASSLWQGPNAPRRLAVAVVASGIVALLLSLSLTRPLRRLRVAVRRLGDGDFEHADLDEAARRRDEIGDLAREFQAMVQRLKLTSEARQRLLRDLSHELRSPLARLQASIELEELRAGGKGSASFERMLNECGRLNSMIGGILALSRAEHAANALQTESFDLAEMLHALVEDAQVEGEPGTKEVRCDGLNTAPFSGNQAIIASGIENVLRNALRYTPAGSTVMATLRETHDHYEIAIRDSGPGVPEEELPRIFEPFYRASNGSADAGGGTGVGLAITANAAQRHGGTLTAKNRKEGGLEVVLKLPKPKI